MKTSASQCCAPGCVRVALPGLPLPLCERHLDMARDGAVTGRDGSVAGRDGETDILPSPCVACGSRLGVRYTSGWLCAVCEWRHGNSPDGELAPPRVDVVYYIRFGDRIKIGTTANPRQRMARIWHDDLLAFERGDRLVEHRRHQQFAASRFGRTEWFEVTDELLGHVAVVGAGQPDPWAAYARWVSEALALRG